jgi:hypothetical protein
VGSAPFLGLDGEELVRELVLVVPGRQVLDPVLGRLLGLPKGRRGIKGLDCLLLPWGVIVRSLTSRHITTLRESVARPSQNSKRAPSTPRHTVALGQVRQGE